MAQARDRDAFIELFTWFAPRVKGYLIGLGTPPAEADDIAQETLLTVWRRAEAYNPDSAGAATWMFTIARNLRIDAIRRERNVLAYQLDLRSEPENEAADEGVLDADRQQKVASALACLPVEQREVVRLSFFLDKPHAEIAQTLGLPLGTVKSRVRLALARLRGQLEGLH